MTKPKKFLVWLALAVFGVATIFAVPTVVCAQTSQPAGITIQTQERSGEEWTPNPYLLDYNLKLTGALQNAAASAKFLDWSLKIYDVGIKDKVFLTLWSRIFGVAVAIYVLLLIIIGLSLILHLEWLERFRRYLPALLISLGIAAVSFWLFYALLWLTAHLQQIILGNLTSANLFSFNLQTTGLVKNDVTTWGSYQSTIFLLKAIAWTCYVLGGIFVLRLIVLWFLVIVSPVVIPFIIYPPTQAVAKAWIREFCRWLFIGPFLALFITAVAVIWESSNRSTVAGGTIGGRRPFGAAYSSGIPVQSGAANLSQPENALSPGTNITISPPGASSDQLYNTEAPDADTYARIIFALLMLWTAAILPFLLTHATMVYIERSPEKSKALDNRLISYLKNAIAPKATPAPTVKHAIPATPLRTTGQPPIGTQMKTLGRPAKRLTTEEAFKQAGFAEFKSAVPPPQARLQNLAALEQNPQTSRKIGETIRVLSEPQKVPVENRPKVQALKEQVFLNRLSGDRAADAVFRLLEKNYSQITDDNLKSGFKKELLHKTAEGLLKTDLNDKIQALQTQNQPGASQAQSNYLDLKAAAQEFGKAVKENRKLPEKFTLAAQNLALGQAPGQRIIKDLLHQEANEGNQDAKDCLWSIDEAGREIDETPVLNKEEKEFEKYLTNEKRDDFAKTRNQLTSFFQTAPPPAGKSRVDWLKSTIDELSQILKALAASTKPQKEAALERLRDILPFLVLGDYDLFEITLYVKAKLAAAQIVYDELANTPAPQADEKYYQ